MTPSKHQKMLHFKPVLVPRCLLSFLLARVAVGEKEADSFSCSVVDEWFLQKAAAHSLHHIQSFSLLKNIISVARDAVRSHL